VAEAVGDTCHGTTVEVPLKPADCDARDAVALRDDMDDVVGASEKVRDPEVTPL
jgi:hypothetical protein